MKTLKASIITIGDELLIGQVIDTNSATIAQMLNNSGISVLRRIAIGDNKKEINHALNEAIAISDVVIMTGGLGPTSDDITKTTLCKYFKGKMVVYEDALNNVRDLYQRVYKKPLTKVNMAQANVPSVCEVIQNKRGSAPGMIFKKGKTIIFSMAGVPFEMEGIMEDVISYLKKRFQLPAIIHKTIVTKGIGESNLAALLINFEKNLPKEISLAYLPGLGVLRLRLSAIAGNKEDEKQIQKQFLELKKVAAKFLVIDNDTPLQIAISKILTKENLSISTAESCTAGKIASQIASVPGASFYFPGAIVSYDNRIKQKELGVKESTLKKHGAVSEETVIEMLKGVIKKMNTTFGIAVSGIMGPGGGSEQKSVGTVWIAVGTSENYVAEKYRFRFDRARNIEATTTTALAILYQFLQKQKN